MNQKKSNRELAAVAIVMFCLSQAFELLWLVLLDSDYVDLCRWDCTWYQGIADGGYMKEASAGPKFNFANWAFFPMFPFLAKSLTAFLPTPTWLVLILLGKVFFLVGIFWFMKLANQVYPSAPLEASGGVVALSPYAIYGNVGYTESLFLLASCIFFWALGARKFFLAALVGGVLSSVRVVGVLATVPYLINGALNGLLSRDRWHQLLLGALIIPVGLSSYAIYLYYLTGDALAFMHIQRAWGRSPGNPFSHLIDGFIEGSTGRPQIFYLASISLFGLVGAVILIRRKLLSLAAFSLLCTLVPLSTELISMPRYVFWQAPILLVLVIFISKNDLWRLAIPVFLVWQGLVYKQWLGGSIWVI